MPSSNNNNNNSTGDAILRAGMIQTLARTAAGADSVVNPTNLNNLTSDGILRTGMIQTMARAAAEGDEVSASIFGRNTGAQIWRNEVGQDAVIQQLETNPGQAQSIINGTNLAVQIFGEKAVTDSVHADPGQTAQIAQNLIKFQEGSGWTTEQIQAYVSQNSNWQQDLHEAVNANVGSGVATGIVGAATGAITAAQNIVGVGAAGLVGAVAGAVVEGDVVSPSIFGRNTGAQIWRNEVGQDAVIQQLETNPGQAQTIINGTNLAVQIFGQQAVSDSVHADPGQAAQIAQNLIKFQEGSGWTTEQIQTYVSQNSGWQQDLQEAVNSNVGSAVVTGLVGAATGALAGAATEGDEVSPSIFGRNTGAQIWRNEVGQDAVIQQLETNPGQAQSIINGTNLAVQIFGEKAVTDSVHADPGQAAQIAQNLIKFQEGSGWTTEQIQTYVSQNSGWQQDLQEAVNSNVGSAVVTELVGAATGAIAGAATPMQTQGTQLWTNELGESAVQNQFQNNGVFAQSVAVGTGIATEIFGTEAVSQAIQQDQDHSATLASNLQQFQANSGWSTEQMQQYISANPNSWEQDLQASVQTYQQAQTGGGDEVEYNPVQQVSVTPVTYYNGDPVPQHDPSISDELAVSQEKFGIGYSAWANSDVGVEAVREAFNTNPEQAAQVATGTGIAEQMFGHEAVESAINQDAGHAAQIASELATFQKESGWSTEQMQDYVANNQSWEQDLHNAVSGNQQQEPSDPDPDSLPS